MLLCCVLLLSRAAQYVVSPTRCLCQRAADRNNRLTALWWSALWRAPPHCCHKSCVWRAPCHTHAALSPSEPAASWVPQSGRAQARALQTSALLLLLLLGLHLHLHLHLLGCGRSFEGRRCCCSCWLPVRLRGRRCTAWSCQGPCHLPGCLPCPCCVQQDRWQHCSQWRRQQQQQQKKKATHNSCCQPLLVPCRVHIVSAHAWWLQPCCLVQGSMPGPACCSCCCVTWTGVLSAAQRLQQMRAVRHTCAETRAT